MAIRRSAVLAVLLVVLAGVWAYHFVEQARQDEIRLRQAVETEMRVRALASRNLRHAQLPSRPHPDYAMAQGLPRAYPKPPSEWQTGEKKLYAELLQGRKFDLVVVPFQVQDFALDRPTRSLMTAELTRAIGRAASLPMADPYVVQRALGDGARRIDEEGVGQLAKQLGAKRVVWGYVGHDRKGAMAVTISVQAWVGDRQTGYLGTPMLHSYEKLAFTDEHPPIEVYDSLLPRILKDLGYDPAASAPPQAQSEFTDKGLPATPFGLTGAEASPARDAYYLQLLGALTPRRAERTRERLFEKSLLALRRMTPASPQYRALKARAYMYLGLRPAALHAIKDPANAEEKELYAALNGDLPATGALAAQQTQLATRLLAMLDANTIAADYSVATVQGSAEKTASLKLPGDFWPVVVGRAFADWSWWTQEENIVLKFMLDQELPVAGYTAEGIVRGAATLGDRTRAQASVDLSVLEHARKLLAATPSKWCCEMPLDRPSARDYLDFMQATATDNLMRRARLVSYMQGLPEQGLEFLDGIQSIYRGFPAYALERARAESLIAQHSEGSAREGQSKAAYVDAFNAVYWSNGQTRVAADAQEILGEVQRQDYGLSDSWYASDYPFRSFFPDWERGGQIEFSLANSRAALANSTSDFGPVRKLGWLLDDLQHKPAEMDGLLATLGGRFAGCPDRDVYLAERSMKSGDTAAAEAHYREGIKDAPGGWESYRALGQLLLQRGQTEQSARLFMSYPGFAKGARQDAVALSNDAFEAGSYFYWSGEFRFAKPLLRIAADLDTGSAASIESAMRLDMLAGNYAGAMAHSLQRAKRYNSGYGYRDYLGMLHAMGRSEEAWSAFNVLVPRLRESQLWETALVGHRRERKSETDIAAWIRQGGLGAIGAKRSDAATYLVRAGITDRMPVATLEQVVAEFAWPVRHLPKWYDDVVRVAPSGDVQYVVGPKSDHEATLPLGVFDAALKEPVKSDLVYFVEAYRALRNGRAAEAQSILKQASASYSLTHPQIEYLLPYYAFAAAKAGDASAPQALLDRVSPDRRGFDYYLAQAVIAAFADKTRDAVELLRNAIVRRPYTEDRPVYPDYQYLETLEWLYRATHKPEYRRLALAWAGKVETFFPWYGWAYAIQAELETDPVRRQRAIALAAYLDPDSERLAAISRNEVASALRSFGSLNPFLGKPGKKSGAGAI
ncbi:MAG TPA: hypothetical protein VLX30_15365 [Burkholderiales bacterium]|nr:hypothetical protein [Burkholderiales bacterium]